MTEQQLDFINAEAFRMYKAMLDMPEHERVLWLLAEVCNLREQVRGLIQDRNTNSNDE